MIGKGRAETSGERQPANSDLERHSLADEHAAECRIITIFDTGKSTFET